MGNFAFYAGETYDCRGGEVRLRLNRVSLLEKNK